MSIFCVHLTGKYGAGKVAIVDEADAEIVSAHNWYLTENGYVACAHPARAGYLTIHRLLMNPQAGEHVDHINHDRLDNRRSNLRICSQRENNKNNRKRNTRNCKGVRPVGKRWKAEIHLNGKTTSLGYYDSETEAGCAYDAAARHYFGEYANCNYEGVESLAVEQIMALPLGYFRATFDDGLTWLPARRL